MQKTVFVLGAGASKPYGFPLGAELSAEICERDPHRSLLAVLGPWVASDAISKADVKRFISAFERSGMSSIDAFLERRAEHIDLGTLAISALISRNEDPDRPFNHATKENWYKALWNEMAKGSDNPITALRNVYFITFNYDRSLENFLFTAIKHAFGTDDAAALGHLKRLNIIHVYGSLGEFHTELNVPLNRWPYRLDPPPDSIGAAARNIRLIPQGRKDGKEFEKARTLFGHAEVICFLGFGFDETNVERLGLADVLSHLAEQTNPLPRIVMSTLHKTAAQTAKIKDALARETHLLIETYDANNIDTLAASALIS